MAMPEAAMHKYYGIKAREDDIWSAWQFASMQAKTKAALMELRTDQALRLSVRRPDSSHHSTANRRRNDITHEKRRRQMAGA